MSQRRLLSRHDWIAVAILCALGTLFFADVLIGTQNVYMRDLTRYYYPTKQILREIVQGGEFPFWNRYFSAGQPIAANPEHEVFYPLTWLILLPSYDLGYRLHILVHIYIGLLGMYALLRSMELRPPAAFFGAFCFGLGGIYLSYVNLLPILFCAAWLPLTCLYVRKFMLRPRVRTFALASLFLGLQFLVGEPTTVMQTGLIIGMYALYRGWYAAKERDGRFWRDAAPEMLARVAFIALISICAIAVGAAQMMPAIDHVGDSARAKPFEFSLVSAWSFPWAKFAEVIYPMILGHIAIDNAMLYWGGGLYPGMGSPFLFSIYAGLLVIALAIAGLFTRPRGGRFVLLLCFLSAIIALGAHTPLLRFLYDHHIAASIRYPEKFILIAIFAITIFAAQMFQRLIDGDEAVREAVMGFVLATAVVAAIFAILTFFPIYETTWAKVWGFSGALNKRMVKVTRIDWTIAALRGAVLFFILWSATKIERRSWLFLLFAFVLVDLGPVVHQLNPRMPSRFFTQNPPVDKTLPQNREAFRVFHEADWYGQEEIAKKYFSTGDAVYWIVRNGLYPMTPAGHRLRTAMERDYDKTALLTTIELTDSIWDVKRSGRKDWWRPFAAMGNVWYRAEYRPFEPEKKRVKGDMKIARPLDFTETEHYPRYYFADDVVQIADRRDFVKKLTDGAYGDRVAFVRAAGWKPANGVVHGYRESANRASIDVDAAGDSFLVMSVTPHKYWRVAIDGRRVQPVVTNLAYQGIRVPRGRHVVTMQYLNDLVVTGGTISIIAIVILLATAIIARRR